MHNFGRAEGSSAQRLPPIVYVTRHDAGRLEPALTLAMNYVTLKVVPEAVTEDVPDELGSKPPDPNKTVAGLHIDGQVVQHFPTLSR